MPKIKLDATLCLTAACSPGKRKTDYWDTITAGFVLECRSTGGKTYYLRYFDHVGRQRQHKIGGHADISFDQARKTARRLRSEVVLGGDPSGAKADKKAIPLYADLSIQHLAHRRSKTKAIARFIGPFLTSVPGQMATNQHRNINPSAARIVRPANEPICRRTPMKTKLNATLCLVADCEPGKRKTDYWDIIIPGFVLEVRSTGGKTYYLRYFDHSGRQRQHKIGGHGDISFDQARKTARRLRSEVVLGGDPAVAKDDNKAIPTYASLATQHLAHAKTHMKSYDSLETIMRLHVVPRWGRCRLDEITAQGVGKWLAEKSDEGLMPATVEKLRVMFGRSFELGRRWGIAGCSNNPTRGIQRSKFDNRRERFLSSDEAGRLLKAAGKSLNPQLRSIVGLLLLTGARVSELLHAEWRHVDLDRRAWLIPTSKTGKARYVPLSQAAIVIIGQLPRFDGCPYLVPNPETKLPFVSIKHAWQTARREARLGDLRIHDLRHSAASFMINAGTDLYAVGKVLGHADHKSTMRYSHLANSTLLAAVEAGAAKMNGITV